MSNSYVSPTAHQRTYIHSSITALAFYPHPGPASSQITLLLSAQDTNLKVYSTTSPTSTAITTPPLATLQIFPAQPIQGLTTCPTTHAILLWGGPWLAIVPGARIASLLSTATDEKETEPDGITILRGPDWIYHGAFLSAATIVVVTAHNEVLPLRRDGGRWSWGRVRAPRSSRPILYAARLECVRGGEREGEVLVAAGTVFGEIVVWRCRVSEREDAAERKGEEEEVEVLYVLTGHEGSIFGVDISPEVRVAGERMRLLASCSDDRTIRVWDISGCAAPWKRRDAEGKGQQQTRGAFPTAKETGFGGTAPVTDLEAQAGCVSAEPVAVAVGHASRIWNVRFARSSLGEGEATEKLVVYSFGEDATAQRWRLDLAGQDVGNGAGEIAASLTHEAIIHRHTGKHIWSSAILEPSTPGETTLVATGGSDGKINIAEEMPPDHKDLRSVMLDILGTEIVRRSPDATRTADETTKRTKANTADGEPFLVYALVLDGPILATTTSGRLYSGVLDGADVSWAEVPLTKEIQHDLRQYQILRSAGKGMALLGSTSGNVYVYSGGAVSLVCRLKGKVSDIFTFGPLDLAALRLWDCDAGSCVPIVVSVMGSPVVTLFILDRTEIGFVVREEHAIEMDAGFVPTAVGCCDGYLVFGSRIGALLVYQPVLSQGVSAKTFERKLRIERPLTKDAVSCIIPLPPHADIPAPYFLTTSRDGHLRIYEITSSPSSSPNTIRVTLRHQSLPPLGPHLESALFTPGPISNTTFELTITGFRSKSFVAWNETRQQELATVECGGASRSFTHRLDARDPSRLAFVCSRGARTAVYAQTGVAQTAVKQGGHGREIKAVAASPESCLVATGAEDTSVRIWGYTPAAEASSASGSSVQAPANDDGLRCLAVIQKHASGIQHLRWAGAHYLLSSSGAEELCIWRVTHLPKSDCDGLAVVCEAMYPDRTRDGDLRIMGFDVEVLPPSTGAGDEEDEEDEEEVLCLSLVLSNSTFKTYTYSRTAGFTLLACGRYTGACLLQIRHLRVEAANHENDNNVIHLLTAATDGRVALWKKSCSSSTSALDSDNTVAEYELVNVVALHQSSIKSLDLRRLGRSSIPTPTPSYVVVTGGDDNALGYMVLAWEGPRERFVVVSRARADGAHAAAVTGLCITGVEENDGDYSAGVCTASTDQRVKSWRVMMPGGGGGKGRVRLVRDAYSGVADAGDLEMLGVGKEVVVVGVGMEVWRL